MKEIVKAFAGILVMATMLSTGAAGTVYGLGATPGDAVSAPAVDPDFKPRLGTYFYKFDFNNMSLGTASITISREGDLYRVQVNAQTNSTVDRIYKIRYRGESLLDTEPTVASIKTKTTQQVKSKGKDMTIQFQPDGVIKTVEKKSKDGEPVEFDVRKIHPDKFTVDPFAATYLVRGLDWRVGSEHVFDVYGGKNPYELRLKCARTETIDLGGVKRTTWVIVPTVKKLDENGQVVPPKSKPAQTKIYLSTDELKDVLKIEASHTLGYFRVTLDRFVAGENQVRETAGTPEAPQNSSN
ncbi:MAG TPA: DUF3108 domain-containing protein [Deltaproteobacteria bacterium]|nr:DUF3108 domain-containing protein [Deltaproteobacteria bacterium]HQI82777.1 DUF3108 domain-containing protein [Deltaproteobacteria bacterium]